MGKRTKGKDRDKYYRLAKDHGYRARSAFKLIEINRANDFLSTAKVCVDLCAAPGGWCQVAKKTMPSNSIVIGVDILPIRSIPGVTTLVYDIITDECRAAIKRELQGWKADCVLHDGAPNVGGAYAKDAYEQNELALAALRMATQHLRRGGTFLTKVYRSSDYHAFVWAMKKFFEKCTTVKPTSSRQQSAEIFLLGTGYLAPNKIDPRMLDPRNVFAMLEDEGDHRAKGMTVMHKKFEKHNKRRRQGYDDSLGVMLERRGTASEFVSSPDPMRLLTDWHVIDFKEDECRDLLEHPATTEDVRSYCSDLRVLSRSDFKALLKWRVKMRAGREVKEAEENGKKLKEGKNDELEDGSSGNNNDTKVSDLDSEDDIQQEILELRLKNLAKAKRIKKKERQQAAKQRQRLAYGMKAEGIEAHADDELFNLESLSGTKMDLDAIADGGEDASDSTDKEEEKEEEDEKDDVNWSSEDDLEDELNAAYEDYLAKTQNPEVKGGRKLAKRSRAAKDEKAAEAIMADTQLLDGHKDVYLKLLEGEDSSDSDSSDAEQQAATTTGATAAAAPGFGLVADIGEPEMNDAVTKRWFSNEIFLGAEKQEDEEKSAAERVIEDLPITDKQRRKEKRLKAAEKRKRKELKEEKEGDNDIEVVRHQLSSVAGPIASDTTSNHVLGCQDGSQKGGNVTLSAASDSRSNNADKLKLIASGMGKAATKAAAAQGENDEHDGFKVIPFRATLAAEAVGRGGHEVMPLPRIDDRTFGSDEEKYDDKDRARHLAMGAMMLKHHRKKEFMDAAYNRYAWSDPKGLPAWFVDDEERHYRPQVPIPKHLLDRMTEKFKSLSSKPIKKVAEARARKRKRLELRMKNVQKQAASMAANPDMSEREKLRAVKSAMHKVRSTSDKPTKVYVASRKFHRGNPMKKAGKTKGAKVKFVDARLRSDTRGLKRAEKRKRMSRGGGEGRKSRKR